MFCSPGPRLMQFLKDHETSAGYKGETMSSKVSEGQFHATYSKPLEKKRLEDIGQKVNGCF